MPRFAATMMGLVLVAFSIGFNTARYPVVWEMVDPARASEQRQAAATPSVEPESPAPAPPVPESPAPEPAKPIEVEPTPEVKAASDDTDQSEAEVADKAVGDSTQADEGGTGDVEMAAKCEEAVEAELAARKPLVPVTAVSTAGVLVDEAVGGAGISRLPPVERSDPNLAGLSASFSGTSIPIYPTTGIQ